jgi:hypothetical protein
VALTDSFGAHDPTANLPGALLGRP